MKKPVGNPNLDKHRNTNTTQAKIKNIQNANDFALKLHKWLSRNHDWMEYVKDYRDTSTHLSTREIAKKLTELQVKTRRNGDLWSKSSVGELIKRWGSLGLDPYFDIY